MGEGAEGEGETVRSRLLAVRGVQHGLDPTTLRPRSETNAQLTVPLRDLNCDSNY